MGLFATKPLERLLGESDGEHTLRRSLGPGSLIALGIGAIIGAGITQSHGILSVSVARTP